MKNLIQTDEFLTAFFGTGAQAVESFADGAGVDDVPDFIDELASWPKAIEGLKDGFPAEAMVATAEQIEAMFNEKANQLLAVNLNPLLVGSIVSSFKATYYTYAAIVQSRQPLIVQ